MELSLSFSPDTIVQLLSAAGSGWWGLLVSV